VLPNCYIWVVLIQFMRLKGRVGNLPKNKQVDVDILIITFVEDGLFYYYAPQLDIYGYGQTETEAKESFETTLHEFFRYTLNKGTLNNELIRLGWKIRKNKLRITAPDFSELARQNTEFQNIINTRPFTKKQHNVQMPLVA
jgi:hypothetical protein